MAVNSAEEAAKARKRKAELMRYEGYNPGAAGLTWGEDEMFTYDPTSGSFNIKDMEDSNNPLYWYDPNQGATFLQGQRITGRLDPRVAMGLEEEDWTAGEDLLKQYASKLESHYGEAPPSYKIEGQPEETAYRWNQHRPSTGDPELGTYYDILSNKRRSQQFLTQQAYTSASDRLGYEDDYWKNLEQQAQTRHKGPESEYYGDEATIVNNPNLSYDVKQIIINDIRNKNRDRGLAATPPTAPEQGTPAIEDTLEKRLDQPTPATQYNLGDTMTSGSKRHYQRTQTGWEEQAQAPTAATYAQDMVGPTTSQTGVSGPTPAEDKGQIQAPWSSDFEKQFLDQLQGFGQNVNTYLGGFQQPQTSQFSLSNYSTPQRNSGLNTGTPQQNLTGTPGQPYTGKGGQATLWR